jgi:hypothetical protein
VSLLTAAPIGIEILDDPRADPALVRRMLTDIARANRWLGGVAAMEAGLSLLLGPGDRGRAVTLLDVGTGAGDLPRAATTWGARRGITIGGIGVERHRAAARLSHEHGVPCVVACGSALPFRSDVTRDAGRVTTAAGYVSPVTGHDAGIDIVLISQLLHHFDDTTSIDLIRAAAQVARLGVILTDLRPAAAAGTAFRMAGWAMRFHRDTIDDGVTSLARGRTAAALGVLAVRAGARNPMARDLALARVVVAWRTAA